MQPQWLRFVAAQEGIPLAIELAAARVKVLPVEQIAARLTALSAPALHCSPRVDAQYKVGE